MKLKKILLLCSLIIMTTIFTIGCAGGKAAEKSTQGPAQTAATSQGQAKAKNLIVYFSWSGNTKALAEKIQKQTGGDLFEIKPAKPYSTNYNETTELAKEEKNKNVKPEISGALPNVKDYEVVFIGFPIWWYQEPMIIDSFVEKQLQNFAGKKVFLFATSGGSDITGAHDRLKKMLSNAARVEAGVLFRGSINETTLNNWLKKIGY